MIDSPVHASESQHFYAKDGTPVYDVPNKSTGGTRPATLADARKLGLVPGVSTVLKMAAQPGLQRWRDDQLLLAALTLPRRIHWITPTQWEQAETEAEWVARVKLDAAEQARAAAERGTEIHAAIEAFYSGRWGGTYHWNASMVDAVDAVTEAIADYFGPHVQWEAERTFATDSFGGKADLCSVYGEGSFTDAIIDVKGKDNRDFEMQPNGKLKQLAWPEMAMQLAAYRVGLGRPEARCANCFISRNEPWTVRVIEWPEKDLQRGWRQFKALLDFWYARSGLGED